LAVLTHQLVAEHSSPLGLPITLTDVYISGSEVEPIPRTDNKASLVIRILEIKPAENGHRYDLHIYGLDHGSHHLSKYLQYKDDLSPVTDLDTTLTITTKHPIETLPEPQDLEQISPPEQSHYKNIVTVVAVIWTLILLFILFYKKRKPQTQEQVPEPTTQEKLQQLLLASAHGDLTTEQQAQLELLVIGHYKKQIPKIQDLPPTQALQELKAHPEASPLILKVEQWLHHPNPKVTQSEIQPLLKPFE